MQLQLLSTPAPGRMCDRLDKEVKAMQRFIQAIDKVRHATADNLELLKKEMNWGVWGSGKVTRTFIMRV